MEPAPKWRKSHHVVAECLALDRTSHGKCGSSIPVIGTGRKGFQPTALKQRNTNVHGHTHVPALPDLMLTYTYAVFALLYL